VREHTVNAVAVAVSQLALPPQAYCERLPRNVEDALGVFVGYLMLDALVANQDRHHQNWGALRGEMLMLAPTFDHGAALARNEPEAKRERRLRGPDPKYNMAGFAAKARSSLYDGGASARSLTTLEAFLALADYRKAASRAWLGRLEMVTKKDFERILAAVPDTRISALTREFTVELLETNSRRLLETRDS
jgi:hypothetical protein